MSIMGTLVEIRSHLCLILLPSKFHMAWHYCEPKQVVVCEDKFVSKGIWMSRSLHYHEMPNKERIISYTFGAHKSKRQHHLFIVIITIALPLMWRQLNHDTAKVKKKRPRSTIQNGWEPSRFEKVMTTAPSMFRTFSNGLITTVYPVLETRGNWMDIILVRQLTSSRPFDANFGLFELYLLWTHVGCWILVNGAQSLWPLGVKKLNTHFWERMAKIKA